MMNRSLFKGFNIGEKFSFEKDIMQKRFTEEKFYAYVSGDFFIDIGIPEDYERLNDLVR